MNEKFVKFAGKTLCREKQKQVKKHTNFIVVMEKNRKKIHWNQQTENKKKRT